MIGITKKKRHSNSIFLLQEYIRIHQEFGDTYEPTSYVVSGASK